MLIAALPVLLVLGFFVGIETIEVKVVITPGDLRLGAGGHIRELGLLVHNISEEQVAQTDVKIFEDESRSKLLTEFLLESKIVEKLNSSVRVLTGLKVEPFNFTRTASIAGCFAYYTVFTSQTDGVPEELATSCLSAHGTWLEDQLDQIGDLPFVNVSFPGSHDAGSYRRYDQVKGRVEYYIFAQEEDVFNQLMYGTRFFDLRVGYTPSDNPDMSDWFNIVHDIYVTPNKVKTVFNDVRAFLELYPNEIVLLDMHRFPVGKWDEETFTLFAAVIEEELGPLIIREDPSQRTLKDIVATGQRVLITWNENSTEGYFRGISNIWANSDKTAPLHLYFQENLPLASQDGWLYSAMAELTPKGWWDIVFDTYGGGLRGLADKHNFEIMLWFRNDRDIRESSTIVAVDFFASTDIAEICSSINLERASAQSTNPSP